MITYGVTCPHCKGAIKVEVSVEKLRVLVSGVAPPRNGGRVKPGITEDVPQNGGDPEPLDSELGPGRDVRDPSPFPQRVLCPTCMCEAQLIEGIAKKNGRPYRAMRCWNPQCPDYNKLVPNTFRWLPQGATV